jgi:serine protease
MHCLRTLLFISCILVFISVDSQAQTIRRVPANHPTIQQAINASVNGDTIVVSPGTYVENINFLGKAITVISESGPQVTVIDGNQLGPVVCFISGEGRSSVLDGFIIRNGSSADSSFQGGGIRMVNSSPTVIRNIITKNAGCEGIGISISSGSPLIQNNVITENTNQLCSGGLGGGGIFVFNGSTAQILDNTITGNFLNSDEV